MIVADAIGRRDGGGGVGASERAANCVVVDEVLGELTFGRFVVDGEVAVDGGIARDGHAVDVEGARISVVGFIGRIGVGRNE